MWHFSYEEVAKLSFFDRLIGWEGFENRGVLRRWFLCSFSNVYTN